MIGFGRALRGEWYALLRRRSFQISVLLVAGAAALRVLFAAVLPGDPAGDAELDARFANFWPRFAQGSRFGLYFAEICGVLLVAGALPRELSRGALRDPMVRRIARPAFLAARALFALLLPLFLGVLAFASAAAAAALLFDAGHVVTAPFQLQADPEGEAAFERWLEEHDLRADELAAWDKLVADGLEPAAAAARLGLPSFELPGDYLPFVPILVFLEEEVSRDVRAAVLRSFLPLITLGCFALCLSVLISSPVLSSGLALGSLILFGVFLAPELGDAGWWLFADWLPGLGPDSTLETARLLADGYTDKPAATPAALAAGTLGAWLEAGVFLLLSFLAFPRKAL